MKVFLTVDTEVWPDSTGWPHEPLPPDHDCAREFASYFHGGDDAAGPGLEYQLRMLKRHGLKATYFVDTLFSYALGSQQLRNVVSMIVGSEQEVGLHLHPEWLTDRRCVGLPTFAGPFLWQYGLRDQEVMLRAGLAALDKVGVARPVAFRAGSWGGNDDTLVALRNTGFTYDSSLNACYAESFPTTADRSEFLQPHRRQGMWEFPVTYFFDHSPAGKRPLQVCACSFDEFRMALESAFTAKWFAVVIVFHSFEFVRVDRLARHRPVTAQRLLTRRFENLCAYLGANKDRFETTTFAELDPASVPEDLPEIPVHSTMARTAKRYVEQIASRFY